MNTITQIRFIWKPIVFLACLIPVVHVVGDLYGITGDLGANPVEAILDRFGNWGIRFVMIALAVTPLRKITGWNWLARFRRMLGLFAFFYVLMHFLTWFYLDQQMLWASMVLDIAKRPYITVGFTALLLLTAMAITSTSGMRRRLGRRWNTLHKSVYVVGVLGVVHYWWQVKSDFREPLIYAAILALLLGYRLMTSRPKRQPQATAA
ncbi:MAG: protein-methionine-sulfoxide reductase heme-binding subunit MsrQ [Woeseiaceae bacterium]|nr:protein-methionine-sulfoxide reductase heme-binding subunit MsrQ [Woeseiaceae bacterium]